MKNNVIQFRPGRRSKKIAIKSSQAKGMLVGCYQGGDAINIDGLMNNDVQPHIKSNNLPVYLSEKQTQFEVDFLNMF